MKLVFELQSVYEGKKSAIPSSTLYDKVKPVFLDLASQHIAGCILKFNNIDFNVISDLFKDLTVEEIYIEQTTGKVFWGYDPKPCYRCSTIEVTCFGCNRLATWKSEFKKFNKSAKKTVVIEKKDNDYSITVE